MTQENAVIKTPFCSAATANLKGPSLKDGHLEAENRGAMDGALRRHSIAVCRSFLFGYYEFEAISSSAAGLTKRTSFSHGFIRVYDLIERRNG